MGAFILMWIVVFGAVMGFQIYQREASFRKCIEVTQKPQECKEATK